jgi:quercetin dioxygenase-like cupin family protein
MNVSHLNRAVLSSEPSSGPGMPNAPKPVEWEGEPPQHSTMVLMTMARGETIAAHTSNAEQVLLVLDGFVEVREGQESHIAAPGNLMLIPANAELSICNMGFGQARVIGYFASANVETRVTETALPEAIPG